MLCFLFYIVKQRKDSYHTKIYMIPLLKREIYKIPSHRTLNITGCEPGKILQKMLFAQNALL